MSALHFQSDGSLWASYRNPVGLTRLRYADGRFEVLAHYTTRNGLPSDVVYDLGEDALGRLWVGTGVGPAIFDGKAFRLFGGEDGLPSEGCSSGAMTQGPDGHFWMAIGDTLVRVIPSRLTTDVSPPAVRLTRVAGPGQEWLLSYRQPSPISQRAASLEFDFCAGALGTEQGIRYQVRMLGLDDTWHDSDGRRESYPTLPPGTFTFQVRAASLNGPWGPIASLPLVILPRWYATLWAKALWALLGMLGVALAVWLQRLRWHRQRAHLERLVATRTEAIARAKEALEEANEALRAQSLTDPLTGLRNRRYLELVVDEDVQRHLRMRLDGAVPPPSRGDLVFILVDLDHFKRVNDTHGHDAGDLVLRETADILQTCVRERDAVIRWGGEEFLILLRETDRAKSVEVAERIRTSLAGYRFHLAQGVVLNLSCSIGFAALPLVPERLDWLSWKRTVKLADRCLYAVKAGGRDGWLGALRARVEDPAAHAGLLDGDLGTLTRDGVLTCAASRSEMEMPGAH